MSPPTIPTTWSPRCGSPGSSPRTARASRQPISSARPAPHGDHRGRSALGLDHETGSLEAGKAADIIAIDISGAGYSETPDYETLLVYSGSGRDVRHVWVAGEQLVNDRKLTRRHFADIRRDYSAAYAELLGPRRASATSAKREVA